MRTIEFGYDSVNGEELNIIAEMNNGKIWFKVFKNNKQIKNNTLTTLDYFNIKEFVKQNSIDDPETESDMYEFQND